jgi:hypothetical protein
VDPVQGLATTIRKHGAVALGIALGTLLAGTASACRGILGIDPLPPLTSDGGSDVDVDAAPEDVGMRDAATDHATYCMTLSPAPSFCADFDRGPLRLGWDDPDANPDPALAGGGLLNVDPKNYVSAPHSAKMTIPPLVTNMTYAASALFKTLDAVPTMLEVDAELLIETEYDPKGEGGSEFLATILFPDNAGAIAVNRDDNGTELAVFDGETNTSFVPFVVPLIVGKWARLQLFFLNHPVDGGPDGTIEVAVEGEFAAEAPVPADLVAISSPPQIVLGPGTAQGVSSTFVMNVDNVTMYNTPR